MDDLRPGLSASSYKKFGTSLSPINEAGESLLHAFNNGSREAFTTIYNTYYSSAFYFAKRFVNKEEAEDVTADVFCKLWNMQKSFTRIQSIKVFLQVSVRNACLGYLEHKEVVDRHRKILLLSSEEDMETFFYEDEIKTEYLQRIYTEMEKLPGQCKKICKLAWFDGLKNREIAGQLHISEKTVCNQKVHGLKLLRISILALSVLLICLLLQTICNI
jgi:RNA polymerase sigma-70 factor (family 1)